MHPDTDMCSPITAMSFGIPLMQYANTSNESLVIGMQQFEYGKFCRYSMQCYIKIVNSYHSISITHDA